jgi:hypothetical protein
MQMIQFWHLPVDSEEPHRGRSGGVHGVCSSVVPNAALRTMPVGASALPVRLLWIFVAGQCVA